jgi:hypothetical protein
MCYTIDNNKGNVIMNKFNPFSVQPRVQLNSKNNQQFINSNVYESLQARVSPIVTNPERNKQLQSALTELQQRIGNETIFSNDDFGRLELIDLSEIDINIDNQRELLEKHVYKIIREFDPRIMQIVNVIRLNTGRYSVPEGQHSAVVLKLLYDHGFLQANFKVQCKVIDEDAKVPGSDLCGEAYGNLMFRRINGGGRAEVTKYEMHKSRVSGVRNYNSTLPEDIKSDEIQTVVEQNNMTIEAYNKRQAIGVIAHISAVHDITGFKIEQVSKEGYDMTDGLDDLNFVLELHNQHFPTEKGVHAGFILGVGRYGRLARQKGHVVTVAWKDAFMTFFKEKYASPLKYNQQCQKRVKQFQERHTLSVQWNDKALRAILILDFAEWCQDKKLNFPVLDDKNINDYNHGGL